MKQLHSFTGSFVATLLFTVGNNKYKTYFVNSPFKAVFLILRTALILIITLFIGSLFYTVSFIKSHSILLLFALFFYIFYISYNTRVTYNYEKIQVKKLILSTIVLMFFNSMLGYLI